jgi:drug/metabolite transporter (DMT)-like permease
VRAPSTAAPIGAQPAAAAAAPVAGWRLQFVLLAVIWGSSFLCIKVLGRVWAPTHVAFGRVALGAAFLVALLALRRTPLPRGARLWGHVCVVALLLNAAPFTLFAYGERSVSSIIAGLWNATTPLLTLAVVLVALPEERPDRRRVAALGAGFAGVVCLLGPWRGLAGEQLVGQLACLAAAACYALGVVHTRRHLSARPETGPQLAAAQLVCATAMLALVAPASGLPSMELASEHLASLFVLGVLGSGVAYVMTYAIVRAAGPTTFSTVTYLIPVVSTALGVAVLSEPLAWNEPAGAAIVLAAMWWSSQRRRAGSR